MPKDKSSCSFSNKSHDFFYKPYSRGSSSKEEGSAEWEDVTCPICMESPHNAVLLLCSSADKGCHPYMCDTSYRHSNCLDQYIKAQAKAQASSSEHEVQLLESARRVENQQFASSDGRGIRTCKDLDLVCPLCRGKVVGWKVVDRARQHLNFKNRGCAQDKCTYVGGYEELRKHARYVHPYARPSEVDPARQRDWWRLERQRDYGDVVSTIHSAMPGATIVGDYVIEDGDEDEDGFEEENGMAMSESNRNWWTMGTMLLLFRVLGPSNNSRDAQPLRHHHHHHHGSSASRGFRGNQSPLVSSGAASRHGLWGESVESSDVRSSGNNSRSSMDRNNSRNSGSASTSSSRRRRRSRR